MRLNGQWIELFRTGNYGDKGSYTAADIDVTLTAVKANTLSAGQLAAAATRIAANITATTEMVKRSRGLVSSLDVAARLAAMREWHRVVRHGGRVMTIEAGPATGIKSFMRQPRGDDASAASGGTLSALEAAGFRPVRLLAEREGYRFSEGIKK